MLNLEYCFFASSMSIPTRFGAVVSGTSSKGRTIAIIPIRNKIATMMNATVMPVSTGTTGAERTCSSLIFFVFFAVLVKFSVIDISSGSVYLYSKLTVGSRLNSSISRSISAAD